ncbi:MAG: adenylate/guanylate cyclase domain-containing protein [bacterium]|jgi:class 3 adenylate cyclase
MILKQYKITLRFLDGDLERQFKLSRESQLRIRLRMGILMSLVFFSSGIPMIYILVPDMFYHLTFSMVGALFPYFFFLFYATYRDKFTGYFHLLAASSNVLSGLVIIYVLQFFPDGEDIMLMLLIFIIFFGLYMYRLGLILGTWVSLIYIISYQFFIAYYGQMDHSQFILLTFLAWLTESFSIIAGYISEQNDRKIFLQQRIISEQKNTIQKEKDKSESLLLNILPGQIADRLRFKQEIIADRHSYVSILFADIVKFTDLAAEVTADELVKVLNHIFSRFDELTVKYHLEKIKTIGDAYMVAGGLFKDDEDHLFRMLECSIEMLDYIKQDEFTQKHNIGIRLGIHAGPVVAGVIGLKKFTYDLWGNTVNVASRMESSGEPGKINISASVYEVIRETYKCRYRGKVSAKNLGEIDMYFVEHRVGDENGE